MELLVQTKEKEEKKGTKLEAVEKQLEQQTILSTLDTINQKLDILLSGKGVNNG